MSVIRTTRSRTAVVLSCLVFIAAATRGDVTPEHRKQASQLIKDLAPAAVHIRKKEFEDAEKLVKEAEEKLKAIAADAGVTEDDRVFTAAKKAIARQQKNLEAAMNKASGKKPSKPKPVSFAMDVAPIIAKNCLGCHGADNPRANLRLDTFAYWRRGGQNGPLAIAGNARASLLALRLVAPNPEQRMPKDADPLDESEIETIVNWINQGANFDGADETASLSEVTSTAALATFEYPKPKGTETVSFTKDIAPWMANLCGGCHSAQRKSGGLSLVSYFDMMQGGESGEVVVPGSMDSRLFRLTGGKELPRMPANQSRLTRKNYEDMVTWFKEGNTFDGDDPRTPLASYVRSDAELTREKFAKFSEEERRKLRDERIDEQWKKTFPKDAMNRVEGTEIVVVGNADKERLQQVADWGQSHLANVRKSFRPGDGPLWGGRLAVFLLKDRFSYNEFSLTINGREAPKEMTGHSVVTTSDEDAYIVLQDVGDEVSAKSPGLQVNLIDHLTGAYLKRGGATVPDWLARGMGLALAHKEIPGNQYLKTLPAEAAQLAGSIPQPEDVFSDATFSPATLPAVGLSLVDFLIEAGGMPKLSQFVEVIRQGQPVGEAAKAVYGADLPTLAQGYFVSLRKRR